MLPVFVLNITQKSLSLELPLLWRADEYKMYRPPEIDDDYAEFVPAVVASVNKFATTIFALLAN